MIDMEIQVKNYLNNFKKEIALLRKASGLTQKAVAKKIGIATQCYQAYESGATVPTLQNFIKLAIFFEVSVNDLLGIQ